MTTTAITVKDGAGSNATIYANDDPSTGAKQDTGNTSLSTIAGAVSSSRVSVNLISGQAGVAAGSGANGATVQRVTVATDDTVLGALTETAPASDTASSGLNGRLQRIAQRITSQIALWSAGAGTAAAALRTTLASDDPAVSVLGATSGAKVITDATGTIQQYLRGLVTQWTAGTLVIGAGTNAIGKLSANSGVVIGNVTPDGTEYETVAASQTAQVLGATGATGDYIAGILVIPATTTPGVVTLLDNATSIPVFVGGASSVSCLVPFFIPLGIKSVSGAWKITTGANVSCIGIGDFT